MVDDIGSVEMAKGQGSFASNALVCVWVCEVEAARHTLYSSLFVSLV